jgi:hypothetical protein
MIYKFIGQEISINSVANTVYGSTLVRVVNPSTSNTVLLVQYANGTTYASGTVLGNSEIIVQKSATDLIIGAGQLASPIAFKS